MAAALTLSFFPVGTCDVTEKVKNFRGTIALSGSYTTGGDTLSLVGCPGVSKPPLRAICQSKNGYGVFFTPGTTVANGTLFITTGSNTELSSGAYPAGLTDDTINIDVYFIKE